MPFTSSTAVSAFMQTRTSISLRRAMYPSLFARIVNHVGRPAMLLGKRFFPETGMPIWKMARSSVLLAVWLPEPLTVATWIEHSLTIGAGGGAAGRVSGAVAGGEAGGVAEGVCGMGPLWVFA